NVARKRYHERRAHRDDSDQIKNCRREIHSSFDFWRLRKPKTFCLKYRKIGLGSRGAENYYRSRPAFCCLPLLGGCPSVRRGEFIQIFQPDVGFRRQLRICLTALLGFIERLRLSYKMTDQPRRIVTRPFEFLRVANRARRASLRTEAAANAIC